MVNPFTAKTNSNKNYGFTCNALEVGVPAMRPTKNVFFDIFHTEAARGLEYPSGFPEIVSRWFQHGPILSEVGLK